MAIQKRPSIKPGILLPNDGERLFNKVADELLNDGTRRMFDGLTPHEQETLLEWFSTAIVDGNPNNQIHDVLWEVDFQRKPVDIETFLKDDNFLGRACSTLDPQWLEDLKNVFAFDSPVMEWVLTGAIGIGKTTIACAGLAYKQYYLSCLRNPAAYYGLLPDSMVVFGIYSITKKQVNDSGYFKLREFIDSSPYFRTDYPRSMKIDSKIVYEKQNVQVVTGSSNLHAIGLDLFSFMMDEVNFMRAKNDPETSKLTGQAYELYNSTYTRLLSRFMRPGGTIPGVMMLLSSRNSQTSFLEERLRIGKGKRSLYVSDYRLWDVKPKHRFVMPWFKVEVGDRIARTRVLKSPALKLIQQCTDKELEPVDAVAKAQLVKPEEEESPRPNAQVISIPGEFLERFQEDPDQALRDIAGVATFNLSPLIRDRQSVYDCFKPALKHPFTRDEVIVDLTDPTMIDEFFRIRDVARIDDSKWVPKFNPNSPRFIHVDNSKTGDSMGFAMTHLIGVRRVTRKNAMDGTVTVQDSPYAMVDLMLRINPPIASEIDYEKVRAFIDYLSRIFWVAGVTYDGFQSVNEIQMMKKAGFDSAVLSVDRHDTEYLALRNALFERRLACYHYKPFEDELLDLQRDINTQKVDHPDRASTGGKGRKDVADAVCGSYWNAITNKQSVTLAKAAVLDDTFDLGAAISSAIVPPEGNYARAPAQSKPRDPIRTDWTALERNL